MKANVKINIVKSEANNSSDIFGGKCYSV